MTQGKKRAGMPGYRLGLDSLGRKTWLKDDDREQPDLGDALGDYTRADYEEARDRHVEAMGDYIRDNFKELFQPYIQCPDIGDERVDLWGQLKEKLDINYSALEGYTEGLMKGGEIPKAEDVTREGLAPHVDPASHKERALKFTDTALLKRQAEDILRQNPLRDVRENTVLTAVDLENPSPALMDKAMGRLQGGVGQELERDLPFLGEKDREEAERSVSFREDEVERVFRDAAGHYSSEYYDHENAETYITFGSLMEINSTDLTRYCSNYKEVASKHAEANREGFYAFSKDRYGYGKEQVISLAKAWGGAGGMRGAQMETLAKIMKAVKDYRSESPHNPSTSGLRGKLADYTGVAYSDREAKEFLDALYP